MAWHIEAAPRVRHLMQILDPSVRAEIVTRVAEIADDPLPSLRPSRPGEEVAETLVLEYDSTVIGRMKVRLLFQFDLSDKRLSLIGVATSIAGDEAD